VRFYEKGDVQPIEVPCGQCVGCRLERSRQWAMRCMHEASLYESNSFVTFTYDDSNIPSGGSLYYRDYQLFMKRLRKKLDTPIRFYMCGEYGSLTARPHYHSILFGCDFEDKKRYRKGSDGNWLYESKILRELWPFGDSCFGDVTFQSAAYVSRYCMAKVTGSQADAHYGNREPEFAHMSLKPGIGAEWYNKFMSDVYPRNYVVVNGVRVKPPKYYDKLFDKLDEATMEVLKYDRSLDIRHEDNTVERLGVRERVAIARTNLLKRGLE
jgi:hypothetical protein